MTVYCLFDGWHDDRALVGVFSSMDAASIGHPHKPKWTGRGEGYWDCSWTRKHHRAKVPVNLELETLNIEAVDGVATLPDGRTIETTAAFVVVAVLPDSARKALDAPIFSHDEYCTYSIEEHEVRA